MRVFDFDSAIVRTPSASVVEGLSAGAQEPPTHEGMLAVHRAYVAALEAADVAVEVLPPLEDFPDSVFVEDPAFVLPEGAVLLRPGAPSRSGEAAEIAHALERRFERVLRLDEGHVDGGDVLILPDEILIGLSDRTNRVGAERFAALLGEFGRRARIVATPKGTLHLKTASSLLDEETVLATRTLAESGIFAGMNVVVTPEGEELGANALRVNDSLLVDGGFPGTAELLARRGYALVPLDVAEIRKIDAGLTCMSLRWRAG
jgi:dimethylargininase